MGLVELGRDLCCPVVIAVRIFPDYCPSLAKTHFRNGKVSLHQSHHRHSLTICIASFLLSVQLISPFYNSIDHHVFQKPQLCHHDIATITRLIRNDNRLVFPAFPAAPPKATIGIIFLLINILLIILRAKSAQKVSQGFHRRHPAANTLQLRP